MTNIFAFTSNICYVLAKTVILYRGSPAPPQKHKCMTKRKQIKEKKVNFFQPRPKSYREIYNEYEHKIRQQKTRMQYTSFEY